MSETHEQDKDIRTSPDSKYRMILVAAARSKQIQKGDLPRYRVAGVHKPTRIALEEVNRGLVTFEILPPRELPGGDAHEDGIIGG